MPLRRLQLWKERGSLCAPSASGTRNHGHIFVARLCSSSTTNLLQILSFVTFVETKQITNNNSPFQPPPQPFWGPGCWLSQLLKGQCQIYTMDQESVQTSSYKLHNLTCTSSEEAIAPGENLRRHGENMRSPRGHQLSSLNLFPLLWRSPFHCYIYCFDRDSIYKSSQREGKNVWRILLRAAQWRLNFSVSIFIPL